MRDCLLRRNGEILGGERAFFDFSLEKTRRYMMGVIDRLYAAGVRYIKNDYNQTIGFGADGGEYPGEKLRASIHGFYQFIGRGATEVPGADSGKLQQRRHAGGSRDLETIFSAEHQ